VSHRPFRRRTQVNGVDTGGVHPNPPATGPVLNLIAALEAARAAEKEQALFYRALAAGAEERGDAGLSERFNELHADEQHHLSRLSARLLELGAGLAELPHAAAKAPGGEEWRTAVATREEGEVRRYEGMLEGEMDAATRALLEEILDTERHHAEELGGKWTNA
jgi:rubrerythrin